MSNIDLFTRFTSSANYARLAIGQLHPGKSSMQKPLMVFWLYSYAGLEPCGLHLGDLVELQIKTLQVTLALYHDEFEFVEHAGGDLPEFWVSPSGQFWNGNHQFLIGLHCLELEMAQIGGLTMMLGTLLAADSSHTCNLWQNFTETHQKVYSRDPSEELHPLAQLLMSH